jgi:hypothetical protein
VYITYRHERLQEARGAFDFGFAEAWVVEDVLGAAQATYLEPGQVGACSDKWAGLRISTLAHEPGP